MVITNKILTNSYATLNNDSQTTMATPSSWRLQIINVADNE